MVLSACPLRCTSMTIYSHFSTSTLHTICVYTGLYPGFNKGEFHKTWAFVGIFSECQVTLSQTHGEHMVNRMHNPVCSILYASHWCCLSQTWQKLQLQLPAIVMGKSKSSGGVKCLVSRAYFMVVTRSLVSLQILN